MSHYPLQKKKSNPQWMRNIAKKIGKKKSQIRSRKNRNRKNDRASIPSSIEIGGVEANIVPLYQHANHDDGKQSDDKMVKSGSNSTFESIESNATREMEDLQFGLLEDTGPTSSHNTQLSTPEVIIQVPRSPLQPPTLTNFNNVGYMDLTRSFQSWTQDIHYLLSSNEFQRVLNSTGGLLLKTTDVAVKTMLLPVTLPIQMTSTVAFNLIGFANDTLTFALSGIAQQLQEPRHMQRRLLTGDSISTEREKEGQDTRRTQSEAPHEQLINAALGFIPFAFDVVSNVRDELGSALMSAVVGENVLQSPPIHEEDNEAQVDNLPIHSTSHIQHIEEDQDECETNLNTVSKISESTNIHVGNRTISKCASNSFSLRVCDLEMYSLEDPKSKLADVEIYPSNEMNEIMKLAIDNFVETATCLATDDPVGQLEQYLVPPLESVNDKSMLSVEHESTRSQAKIKTAYGCLRWKEEWCTGQHIKTIQATKGVATNDSYKNVVNILEKELLLWSGKVDADIYGKKIPMLKVRGIVDGVSPLKLLEIFIDSTKVNMYNKYSQGRKDLHLMQEEGNKNENENKGFSRLGPQGLTKIVQNETKVPLSNKIISVTSLLHARNLDNGNDDGFIIVSRSLDIKKLSGNNGNKHAYAKQGSKNEIIWGVNVLRKVPGHSNKVDVTNLSQMNSASVPGFLADKVSMMGANDFFKALRSLQQ